MKGQHRMKMLMVMSALALGLPALGATAEGEAQLDRRGRERSPAVSERDRREDSRDRVGPRREDSARRADRDEFDREQRRMRRPLDRRDRDDVAPRPPRYGPEGRARRLGPEAARPGIGPEARGPRFRAPGGRPGWAGPSLAPEFCPCCKRPLGPLPPCGRLGPAGRDYAFGYGPRRFRGELPGPLPPRFRDRRGPERPVPPEARRWRPEGREQAPFGPPRFRDHQPLPPGAPGDLPPRPRRFSGQDRPFDRFERDHAGPPRGPGAAQRPEDAPEQED